MTMQVEGDGAGTANPREWLVSKDDLRSLKKDIELRIFQISEEQQSLELKEMKQICSIDLWMRTAFWWMALTFFWTTRPYSVSTGNQIWQI